MIDDRRAHRRRFALPGLCVLASVMTAGCGSYGSVSGKISYKGEPLGGGTVLFFSEGNRTASSAIGPNGEYQVENVSAGPVRIAVETTSARPDPSGAGPAAPTPGKYVSIPESYSDPYGSGLTYTVKAGPQPYDIDLK